MLLIKLIYIIIIFSLNIQCINIKFCNNFMIKKNNFINLKNEIIYYINNDVIIKNNCIISYEYRIKNINKILYKKFKKNREINDIYGLRIIYFIKLYDYTNINNNTIINSDYNYNYNLFYAYYIKFLLENKYNTILKYYDDYIINPKNNNYRSLHIYINNYTVIEVQIRDINMHYDALYGSASLYY